MITVLSLFAFASVTFSSSDLLSDMEDVRFEEIVDTHWTDRLRLPYGIVSTLGHFIVTNFFNREPSNNQQDALPSQPVERAREILNPNYREVGDVCSICLEGFRTPLMTRMVICKHVFHRACYNELVAFGHQKCPVCRL